MEGAEDGIAVIGIGCNFPGGMKSSSSCLAFKSFFEVHVSTELFRGILKCFLGEGLENFWKILLEGTNCVTDIPAQRFNAAQWFGADDAKPGETTPTKAALIEG